MLRNRKPKHAGSNQQYCPSQVSKLVYYHSNALTFSVRFVAAAQQVCTVVIKLYERRDHTLGDYTPANMGYKAERVAGGGSIRLFSR